MFFRYIASWIPYTPIVNVLTPVQMKLCLHTLMGMYLILGDDKRVGVWIDSGRQSLAVCQTKDVSTVNNTVLLAFKYI